jgi:hypothetical protein
MGTIQLIQTTPEQLAELINEGVKSQLKDFQKELTIKEANDELLTRKEACEFLKINSSTLWAWSNKGKVKAYGIANRRYYKRSELIESLILVKK